MKTITLEELHKIDLSEEFKGKITNAQDLASELMLKMSRPENELNGIELRNWHKFNQYCGGLRASELTVITSDTGLGKTTFAMNMASKMVMQGHRILYISLENSILDVLESLAIISTNEPVQIIPTPENKEVLNLFCNTDGERLYFLEQSHKITMDIITRAIFHCKKEHDIDLVVLDHLDAVYCPVGRGGSETKVQSDNVYTLRNTCLQTKVHCIAIQHPAKLGDKGNYGDAKKRQDRHLMIDEIKGSSAVKQVADMIFTLRRPSEFDTVSEITIQKMRYKRFGRYIGKPISFVMDPLTYSFTEKYDDGL